MGPWNGAKRPMGPKSDSQNNGRRATSTVKARPESAHPARDPYVWIVVLGLWITAGAACFAAERLHGLHHDQPLAWLAVAAAMVGIGQLPIKFHFGRQSHSVNLDGAPLLVGAILLSPEHLLLATAVARVCSIAIWRPPLQRAAFNLANALIGSAVTLLVLLNFAGSSSIVSLRAWGAIGLAAVININKDSP